MSHTHINPKTKHNFRCNKRTFVISDTGICIQNEKKIHLNKEMFRVEFENNKSKNENKFLQICAP